MNSYEFIEALSDWLTPDDVIVTDTGFAFQATHQALRIKAGQRLMSNGGLAAMGWGLPAAIGACYATGRRTVLICGDGGLMMNVQELATIGALPIVIFMYSDGGYATIRETQDNAGYARFGEPRFPRWEHIAMAHRLAYAHIYTVGGLAWAAQFNEVVVDRDQRHRKAVNKRAGDRIVQTALEDSYPFLDEAEIAANLRGPQ